MTNNPTSLESLLKKIISEIKVEQIEYNILVKSQLDTRSQEFICFKYRDDEEKRREILDVNKDLVRRIDKQLEINLANLNALLNGYELDRLISEFNASFDPNNLNKFKEYLRMKHINKHCFFISSDRLKNEYKIIYGEIGLFIVTDWYLDPNQLNYLSFAFSDRLLVSTFITHNYQLIYLTKRDIINELKQLSMLKFEFASLINYIDFIDGNLFDLVKENLRTLDLDEFNCEIYDRDLLTKNINLLFKILNNYTGINAIEMNRLNLKLLEKFNFDHMSNVKRISLQDNNVEVLTANVLNKLSNSYELNFDQNRIYLIERNGFSAAFKNLKKLTLTGNETLQAITINMFASLVNLEILLLNECNISQIDDFSFKNLSKLERLDLVENGITIITAKTFDGLTNLKHLSISHNKISSIEDYAFKKLDQLKLLNISRNPLDKINVRMFNGLPNLEVFLIRNKITHIEENSFQTLVKLKKLDLWHALLSNEFTTTQPGIFNGLKNLAWLWIRLQITSKSKNHLNNLFERLENLSYLKLKRSVIEHLDAYQFKGLDKLKILNLSHCCIKSIHKDALRNLVNLEKLYLYNNHIVTSSSSSLLSSPVVVSESNEKFFNIEKFNEEFGPFPHLTHLNSKCFEQEDQLDDEMQIDMDIKQSSLY